MFFISHKICNYCEKLGHKRDMVQKIGGWVSYSEVMRYYHPECWEIKYNLKPCPCGEGYINKE